jgi:GT2 family glycosyltransferase
LDLCYKVERSGLSNYYVGGATIVHYAGKSSAPEWQTIMKLRSEVRFCVKNYGPWYGSAFRFAMGFNAIARLSLIAMFSVVKRDAQQRATLKSAALKWKSTIKALISPAFSSQYPTKEPKSTPKLYESNV